MGTSAPVRRTHDFPITEPYHPPQQLPAPDPDHWIVVEPVRQPEREPVPVRKEQH